MADDTLERDEKQKVGRFSKPLRCRFHETEEYHFFCQDCKDFMCFKCIGHLHQKHELSQLRDAEKDIRTKMCVLLLENKYPEQLKSLSDKVSDKEKELVQDEESLKREIRTSVDKMKQNIDLSEKRLLSRLRNAFESYQISLQEQKTNVNNLQTEIANLDVNKLHEYHLNHIINTMSEMKVCFSTCDKIRNHPKPCFKPTMEFSIGNIILSDGNLESDTSSLPSCSDISIQTDCFEDSDTEWFDAEDISIDDLIESSSDEVTNEYPIHFQLKKEITLIRKIVPISEKNAWIISDRKLRKVFNNSLEDDVYAEKVDDIILLKDGGVLILSSDKLFIMKLLPNRRLVRFADVCSNCLYISYRPYCFCMTKDDLIVVYLWSLSGNKFNEYQSKNNIIWMTTDGIMVRQSSFIEHTWQKPSSIQNFESSLCILYRVETASKRHRIDLLDARSSTFNMQCDFKGLYGLNPKFNFQCEGMCIDKAGNILVSDIRHHSVFVLDKKLKFKKTLFDARNGLDEPAAIAVFNDQLWVSDGNQIFIFQYTDI